jgi:hypothetical protein
MQLRLPKYQYLYAGVLAMLALVAAALFGGMGLVAHAATGPTIQNIQATASSTSATITWTTDVLSTDQVSYGTTTGSYTASSTLDSGLMTNHSATLTGLMPDTTYFFVISSMNASSTASTSPEMTFMTTTTVTSTSTGTTTGSGTSTDTTTLQNEITDLQNQINALKAQVDFLLTTVSNGNTGSNSNGNGGSTGTTTTTTTGSAGIDQNGHTVTAGTSIDFGGHGFGSEEHVNVMLDGQKVGEAFTNKAGSFSTGSMSVPNMPGTTSTYTFIGQNSGLSATATITLR